MVASCKNDIDDQVKIDDFVLVDTLTQNEIDCDLSPADGYVEVTGNSQSCDNDVTHVPVDGYVAVQCDRHVQTDVGSDLLPVDGYVAVSSNCLDLDVTNVPVDGYVRVLSDRHVQPNLDPAAMYPKVHSSGNTPHIIPEGIKNITELTQELFDNNYHLYAKKINHYEDGLFIRAILMKNNTIFFNYTYKINGTSNVATATIASTDQVCNHYLVHAEKGDTFLCSLGDGHNGVRNSIIRNEHLAKFITTLYEIKAKIGLYTIVSGLKSDWLQYASHNSTYQELSLAPDKKNPSFQPLNHS